MSWDVAVSEAEMAEARADAERLMSDTFTLSRPTGEGMVYDPAEQAEVEATDLLGTSPGKVQSRALATTEAEVGGRTAATIRLEVHLPVSAVALRRGDYAAVTALGPMTTPSMSGRKFRVVGPVGKSWATAARYEVEEVVS